MPSFPVSYFHIWLHDTIFFTHWFNVEDLFLLLFMLISYNNIYYIMFFFQFFIFSWSHITGWLDCPAQGQELGCIIPSKVPLGESFNDYITSQKYTPKQAILQQSVLGREVSIPDA